MTGKADVSEQEWKLVLEGPPSAGVIVLTAQHGGSIGETFAMAKAYAEARQPHGGRASRVASRAQDVSLLRRTPASRTSSDASPPEQTPLTPSDNRYKAPPLIAARRFSELPTGPRLAAPTPRDRLPLPLPQEERARCCRS